MRRCSRELSLRRGRRLFNPRDRLARRAHPGAALVARVLLLGANGQVGWELARLFAGDDLLALDRAGADLARPESLRQVVRDAKPELILNAAAYTAVDRAESEPDLADRVNHLAPGVLAEEAERLGALLVHYSTDYVFDGTKREPYVETDEPNPLNVYGATKLAGERAIARACARHLILRTSWVYSHRGHNFLLTMLRLGREREVIRVVDDQWGAPTSAAALAEATQAVVHRVLAGEAPKGWPGVYHCTCAGETTWAGFARAIFAADCDRNSHPMARVAAISTIEYPTPAQRPHRSTLSTQKLSENFRAAPPEWNIALQRTLEFYKLFSSTEFAQV